MYKKMLFIALVLFGLLFSDIAGQCFADMSAQFKLAHKYSKNEQYEQAEQIYQQIVTDYAFQAQKNLAILYVAWNKPPQADSALQELLTKFSGHKGIPEAINQVADNYGMKLKRYDKSRQLHQYVLDHYPGDEQTMWAQQGLAFADIRRGNYAAAEAAIEKLLANFPKHKGLPKALNSLGKDYRKVGKYQRARKLHQYVLDNHPDFEDAIFSQRGVIISSIALGDDSRAEAGINELLSQFSLNEYIANAVYHVARKLNRKNDQKAQELYEYIRDNHSGNKVAVLARVDIGQIQLRQGDDAAARAIFDGVLADFSGHSILPKAVHLMAEGYREQALFEHKQYLDAKADDHFLKALAEWERIIYELPETHRNTTAQAHHFAAECYRRFGQHQKAIEHYQKLADYQPDYPYASRAPSMVRLIKRYIKNMEEISESGAEPPPPLPRWLGKNVNSNEGGQK
ncbi:MAG: tetratricopeptide repeat protein [Planctomycetes bacterium]|nr:tetratricopeptide repeat protein [Planctomycetota bacterium]MCH8118781.1 tetratricopeptide repeat protein [Planctomycetota bacterium]